jgi:hypothetical protein
MLPAGVAGCQPHERPTGVPSEPPSYTNPLSGDRVGVRALRRLVHPVVAAQIAAAVVVGLAAFRTSDAQSAVVTRNVNLREGPSTAAEIVRLLQPPDELLILSPDKVDGYYEARTVGGDRGWVWASNIRVTGTGPEPGPGTGPAEVFRGCPLEGETTSESYRESNRKKNRITAPSPAEIEPSATAQAILAPGGDESRWSDARAASIVAYVVDVKTGGEETVNCGETLSPYVDTHIEVVLDPGETRRIERLIVEVTPRWRAYRQTQGVDWSTATLEQTLEGRWVRFTGWLFWDFVHADEAEHTRPGRDANWRATAWEIHPVTSITVCAGSPQNCD